MSGLRCHLKLAFVPGTTTDCFFLCLNGAIFTSLLVNTEFVIRVTLIQVAFTDKWWYIYISSKPICNWKKTVSVYQSVSRFWPVIFHKYMAQPSFPYVVLLLIFNDSNLQSLAESYAWSTELQATMWFDYRTHRSHTKLPLQTWLLWRETSYMLKKNKLKTKVTYFKQSMEHAHRYGDYIGPLIFVVMCFSSFYYPIDSVLP